MAVTTSFFWNQNDGVHLMNNVFTANNQFLPEVAANAARTEFFGAWSDGSNGIQAEGRVIASDGRPVSDEFTINVANNTGIQFDADVAGLSDGSFVAVYQDLNSDLGGDIRATFFTSAGSATFINMSVDTSAADDSQPRVAALANDAFVVTWTRGIGDSDIRAAIFKPDPNPDAGPRATPLLVDGSAGTQTAPDVAALASGNFVEVWEDDSNHTVYFRRFDSNGIALDPSRVAIDGIGTVNKDIHVVGLSDGGFAVAYTDNGWGISGTEITFQIFNGDGTARTGFIRANDAALGGLEGGDQDRPTITTLGDGLIVVGWQDEITKTTYAQVFDPAGNAMGTNQALNVSAIEADFAGLSGADLAIVLQSTVEESPGNGNSIRAGVIEFTRSFNGDNADNIIVGLNDGLRQIFSGQGGDDTFIAGNGPNMFIGSEDLIDTDVDTVSYVNSIAGVTANLADSTQNRGPAAHDTYFFVENLTGSNFNDTLVGDKGANALHGGAGNDKLTGGAGNDVIDGGDGGDIAFFSGLRSAYKVFLESDGAHVVGPDGSDLLHNVESFVFDDTAIAAPQPTHWSNSVAVGAHPAGWVPSAGVSDFSGDGTADIGWFNPTTGDIDLWTIQNGQFAGSIDVGTHPAGWSPAVAGNFDASGGSDIAWYNPSSHDIDIWKLAGGHWAGSVDLGSHPAGWNPSGAGDFNHDGTQDILWYNPISGDAEIWLLSNAHWAGSVDIGTHPAGWRPAGAGDFDGDGTSDVAWYNPTTNDVEIWKIANGHWAGSFDVGSHPAGWTLAGVGDFNGDGISDILWHNPASGDVDVWRIVGNHWDGSMDIGAHPTGSNIVGLNDLNHDGRADVVWQDTATGAIENWILGN